MKRVRENPSRVILASLRISKDPRIPRKDLLCEVVFP